MIPVTGYWAYARQDSARAVKAGQIAFVVLVTVACGGCISIGKRIDQQLLAQIKVGVSTRGEVESLLGAPQAISETPTGGTMLSYWHWKGWLVPPGEILLGPAVKWLWTGGSSSKTESVAITLDSNGVVSDVSSCVLELEGGHGLLDRNRQSLSWTSSSATDSDSTETEAPAAEGHPPERIGAASQPESPADHL